MRSTLDTVVFWGMRLVCYVLVGVVGYILFDIIRHGLPALSPSFLFDSPSQSGAEGGILPCIVGTLYLVTGTMAVAAPLGMATAIFLNEYSGRGWWLAWIRVAIITLAGVPSIVFGLFGLGLFVLFFNFGASILSGCLTLACMVLPTIIVASEEALKAVPRSLREGSLALGATQWQTIRKNVLPYALPGMLTGSILGIGRAAGETAPILFTAAAFYLPGLPHSIFDQVMALPYHLYILATQHPDAQGVRGMQYGTALVLVLLVLGLNGIAVVLRYRMRRKYRW